MQKHCSAGAKSSEEIRGKVPESTGQCMGHCPSEQKALKRSRAEARIWDHAKALSAGAKGLRRDHKQSSFVPRLSWDKEEFLMLGLNSTQKEFRVKKVGTTF